MHTMLFAIVFLVVAFVFLCGLKRERVENQLASELARERKLKNLHNSSYRSERGCPIYEDHFAIHNRMPIIE